MEDRRAVRTPAPLLAAIFTLVLLWPALLTGGALWFDDLSPYVRGGEAAVRAVFEPPAPTDVPSRDEAGGGLAAELATPIHGVRSVAYSLAAYLAGLPLPRFWALVIGQAAATGVLLAMLVRRERGSARVYVALVALGGAPIAVSTASPDVWAGILLLGVLLLTRHHASLGRPAAVFAGLCVAFAVAAHASHLLLGAALGVLVWAWPRVSGGKARGGGLLLGAVALGALGVIGTSIIGFGEASLAPKRYPIVLARAIEDGPALWHLEEHCDEHRYAVCEVFGDDIPDDIGAFLWDEGGLRDRATPAQMERVRAEEALIVRRATAEYPLFQARRAAVNFVRQAGMIAQAPSLGLHAARDGDDAARGGRAFAPAAERVLVVVQSAVFVGTLAVLLGLLALRYVRPGAADTRFLAVAAAGFLANAAICGVLSVPTPRYQARIAWVLPIVCVAVVARRGGQHVRRDDLPGGLDAA